MSSPKNEISVVIYSPSCWWCSVFFPDENDNVSFITVLKAAKQQETLIYWRHFFLCLVASTRHISVSLPVVCLSLMSAVKLSISVLKNKSELKKTEGQRQGWSGSAVIAPGDCIHIRSVLGRLVTSSVLISAFNTDSHTPTHKHTASIQHDPRATLFYCYPYTL